LMAAVSGGQSDGADRMTGRRRLCFRSSRLQAVVD